jgi:hypothetical protein
MARFGRSAPSICICRRKTVAWSGSATIPNFDKAWAPELRGWNPLDETKKGFRISANSEFRRKLKDYIQTVERQAVTASFIPVPERKDFDAFRWIAGYQCCGWSIEKIAKAAHRARQSVQPAVEKIAELIDLTLRPPAEYDKAISIKIIRTRLKLASQNTAV